MKIFSSILFLSLAILAIDGATDLGKFNIAPGSITVSGISSGGAMATQFHFAFSSEVKGAGIFAGVPFLCAYKSLSAATACTVAPSLLNINGLVEKATTLAIKGDIDPLENIKDSEVYIWQGKLDPVVKYASGGKIQELYERFGAHVSTVFTYKATHGQPTDNIGAPCGILNPPKFINNCHYKGAWEMLNKLYKGTLNPPSNATDLEKRLVSFNQREFLPIINGMANSGFLYVPSGCKDVDNQCRLHIAFHGCLSNQYWTGNDYATKTGYIEAAEANNIIILFPQTDLTNPMGCWDFFGNYGLLQYPTKGGLQMESVHKMLTRIVHG